VFQCTFAIITACLIVGAFAERMKFSAVLLFMVLWFTCSSSAHCAHGVVLGGSRCVHRRAAADKAQSIAGFIFPKGALDFAGGTVVHINAGIAGLVGAVLARQAYRLRQGSDGAAQPDDDDARRVAAWVGWSASNAGSNLEATGTTALVFANTFVATAAAALSWMFLEWMFKGKLPCWAPRQARWRDWWPSPPACGWVGPNGRDRVGLIVGAVCLWSVNGLKRMFGYDDALDVFGVHCIGASLARWAWRVRLALARRHRRLRLRG